MKQERRGYLILMADGNIEDHSKVKAAARQCGINHVFSSVYNGVQLRDYIQRTGVYKEDVNATPDLLIMDIQLDLIDSFDHAICFWEKDDSQYIDACQTFSARWISLPVSPSAEQFSRIFFYLAQQVLQSTITQNGEGDVEVYSVIVHETDTGYAQSFIEDIQNEQMGILSLDGIVFSEQIQIEWANPQMYEDLKNGIKFNNPQVDLQVEV